jgi:hypothetical protein
VHYAVVINEKGLFLAMLSSNPDAIACRKRHSWILVGGGIKFKYLPVSAATPPA